MILSYFIEGRNCPMFACNVCGQRIDDPRLAWAIWRFVDDGKPEPVEHVHKGMCLQRREQQWGHDLLSDELVGAEGHLGHLIHNTAFRSRVAETEKGDTVYVIRAVGADVFKIGFSGDVDSRLASLQTASAFPLKLLASRPGGEQLERALHAAFSEHRMRGEWFRICSASEPALSLLVAGDPLETIEAALQLSRPSARERRHADDASPEASTVGASRPPAPLSRVP